MININLSKNILVNFYCIFLIFRIYLIILDNNIFLNNFLLYLKLNLNLLNF